ncbi:T9SS type A sorting domain-containing protein [uncultured Polaribacter sp.]|uniref:T9SS type A sorting domain-containing protein n=1 Tax=uncultured Polaribacter sp. TaxID=174711 RepID=UPI00261BA31E|nr:T9SS type A sorting domain-containing protein [uncultured Polaribacter sp.]
MKTKLFFIVTILFSQIGLAQYNINSNELYPIEIDKIVSAETTSYFGNSISFSNDGSVLAIGEYGYGTPTRVNIGRVKVYTNETGSWLQKGQDLIGVEDFFNTFGKKVELSSDGNTLAVYDSQIGITLNTGETLEDKYGDLAPQYFPYIQVYQFENGTWTKIGEDFLWDDVLDIVDMSLSGDGTSIAIASKTGTKIYELNANSWLQIGQEIAVRDELFDEKIDLSADGKTLIIGDSYYSDPNSIDQLSYEGQVKVYQYNSNTWGQLGNTIKGTEYLGYFGRKVSIAENGKTIAIGTAQTNNADYVAVLELTADNWMSKGANITQDGSSKIISMQLSGNGNAIVIGEAFNTRVLKFNTDWDQVNLAFESDDNTDEFGYAVAISGNGEVYAVGAPSIATSGKNGYVSIFNHNKNNINLFGEEFYGNAQYDYLGNSVSVSENGNIIAVGASGQYQSESVSRVMVYEKTINGLEQIGEDILNPSTYTYSGFGSVVEINANGSLLAISAPNLYNSDYGAVYVYQRSGNNWVPFGNQIIGDYGSSTGVSISFSNNGSILAVGSYGNPGGVNNEGHKGYTTVYNYTNANNTWEVLGERILGEATGDYSGGSVHLSGDGKTLAIGATGNDGETINNGSHGHVRVFQYNNNNWEQKGNDVDGNPDFNANFGGVVKLSNDGKTLMVSDINSQTSAGSVELFKWDENNSSWVSEIILKSYTSSGTNNGHRFEFGKDISISNDGNILVIGEHKWQDLSSTTDGRGKVHIYIKSASSWVKSELFLEGRHRRQYFGESVSLSGNGNTLVVGSYNYGAYDENVNSYAGMAAIYQLNLCSSIDNFIQVNELGSPITSIPDTNFEQYLIDENIDSDATLNGRVLTADIENITQVLVNDKNISNLTGIQDFISLKELDAANNLISSIDLSKNLQLEIVSLENNHISNIDFTTNLNLKNINISDNQLTEIDVNLLENLESLQCYKNQLTSINLISNKKLQLFVANENQLKQLDVRQNRNLIWLDVDDNNLESLVIKNGNNTNIATFSATGNTNLTCIEVDDASYSNSNWTNKDTTAFYTTDCAPANDVCSNAIPLVFGQQTLGDVNSGTANNNPSCAVGNVIADVWFSVIVPQSGEFSIEGSGFGGQLKFAIYQSCSSLAPIACGTAISLNNLTVGTTFYLKVWLEANAPKTQNTSETGTFTLKAAETSVLSVEKFLEFKNELVLYPNPASTIVTVKLLNNSSLNKVEVFNTLGKKVLVKNGFNNSKLTINTSNLSKGIYFIKTNTENQVVSKRFIIN